MEHLKELDLAGWLELLENRHQQEIQLGLDRIRQVAIKLGLLHPEAYVISVAGTNGKGSTVSLLESIYLNAGYSVASYTSPHLLHFNERIKVNQVPIPDQPLITAFAEIERARANTHLTYFETVTLAALWHFKQQELDVIILEVGLGGRLDATNIIDSDLAIITTIDYDHQAFLGNTKEAIGFEKAGILREGKPFIFADTNPPQSILEQAQLRLTQPIINGQDYHYRSLDKELAITYQGQLSIVPRTSFHSNAVVSSVIATICMNAHLPVSFKQMVQGISNARLPGRLQLFQGKHLTLVDVAHNPQSANHLALYLKSNPLGRRIFAVFSALEDKDIKGLIAPLLPLVTSWYPAQLSGKRAASANQIKEALHAHDVMVSLCYNDPPSAYRAACAEAEDDDLILVYGSFLTVAACLEAGFNDLSNEEIL
jgi:dihydrofolate synthase/folylpolyglutamate synthase